MRGGRNHEREEKVRYSILAGVQRLGGEIRVRRSIVHTGSSSMLELTSQLVREQIATAKDVYPSTDKQQYDIYIACFSCVGLTHDVVSSLSVLSTKLYVMSINAVSELRHVRTKFSTTKSLDQMHVAQVTTSDAHHSYAEVRAVF